MIISLLISITISVYYFKLSLKERQVIKKLSINIERLQEQLINSRMKNKIIIKKLNDELDFIKNK